MSNFDPINQLTYTIMTKNLLFILLSLGILFSCHKPDHEVDPNSNSIKPTPENPKEDEKHDEIPIVLPSDRATVLIIKVLNGTIIANFRNMFSSSEDVEIDFATTTGSYYHYKGKVETMDLVPLEANETYFLTIEANTLGINASCDFFDDPEVSTKEDKLQILQLSLNEKTKYTQINFNNRSHLETIQLNGIPDFSEMTAFTESFLECTRLKEIPTGLFDNSKNTTSFSGTFQNCTSLKEIPVGLFDNNKNTTIFNYTFSGCTSLKEIPTGLFDNNEKVTDFGDTFASCSSLKELPAGLFGKNKKAWLFSSTFRDCISLTTVPQDLFMSNNDRNNQSFLFTFQNCTSLTKETVLNLNLWENPIRSSSVACFKDCKSDVLAIVPTGWK